jgi:histidyl-tRNA synthetase
VEEIARQVFGSYGYGEIRTPIVEETDLFVRSVGESTDIVGKEMYTFADKKGRSLTLRPESTAAVARAVIQHGLRDEALPIKLFYIGPHFRYERPQKGRYRQFSQIGAELVGDAGPYSDAEVLQMLVRFLQELGFSELVVLLNTVGDEASRAPYREALRNYLSEFEEVLGADSKRRLEINPLRLLDTKVPAEIELLQEAPRLSDYLSASMREHFDSVCNCLSALEIPFQIEERLVRGLDYYVGTVFEIVSKGLGSQDAIVGGGRYDGLLKSLGGADLPGIGFAIGQDRLIEAMPDTVKQSMVPNPPLSVVAVGGVEVELGSKPLKHALKRADRAGVRFVVLVGPDELSADQVTLRDLRTGEQESLHLHELPDRLGTVLGASE